MTGKRRTKAFYGRLLYQLSYKPYGLEGFEPPTRCLGEVTSFYAASLADLAGFEHRVDIRLANVALPLSERSRKQGRGQPEIAPQERTARLTGRMESNHEVALANAAAYGPNRHEPLAVLRLHAMLVLRA